MFENLDKLIDINLKLLCEFKGSLFMINRLRDENNRPLSSSNIIKLTKAMKSKGLIDMHSNEKVLLSNEFGSNIHKNGGWLKYVSVNELLKQSEIAENHIKRAKERLERDKLVIDYKLSKWQLKTFWFIFGFGLFGGVYSIYDAFIKTQKTEEKLEQIEQNIQENKESIKKLHISISDQKNLDSVNKPKSTNTP